MYRNYMAWFLSTLAALFAAVILTIFVYLTAINPSYAEPSDPQPSGSKSAAGDGSINSDAESRTQAQQTAASTESVKGTSPAAANVIVEAASLDMAPTATTNLSEAEPADESEQRSNIQASESPASIVQVESEVNIAVENSQDAEPEQQSDLLESNQSETIQLTTEEQVKVDGIVARQLTQDLEQQLQQLHQSLQTEDAFSSNLGENYLGYGKLLRKAGRVDEAIKALTSAFHIAKVNNGIYSIEQRPALHELFDIHYELANTEDFEDYLERILWVENKNPEFSDNLSYELLLKVGNRYIDQFLRKPVAIQTSVETLLRAKNHLVTAVRKYGKRPLAEMLMPYGELALISFLQAKIQPNVDRTASLEDPRLRRVKTFAGSEMHLASYFEDPFPKGEAYLQIYLRKAQKEGSTEHVVRALASLGDLNQLFGRYSNAGRYYELAWLAAQELAPNQQSVLIFEQPTLLPDFNYAYPRQNIPSSHETISVSLTLRIGSDGRVKDVQRTDPDDGLENYFLRARRAVKRLVFRPQFADAKAVPTEQYAYTTKVRLRK
jgi:tetratricopeptide (TPR) repeat protein